MGGAPQQTTRRKVLGACVAMGVAAVAVITGTGIGFRSVLCERAQAHCIRIADVYAAFAQQRLTGLTLEAQSLAKALAERAPRFASPDTQDPSPDAQSVLCAWAVYDAGGQRLAGKHHRRDAEALGKLGLCTQRIVAREMGRMAEALGGTPSVVLVPGDGADYALHYTAISRDGKAVAALQAVARMTHSASADRSSQAAARLAVRPFGNWGDAPRRVAIGGVAHLVVQRPLEYRGRRLGALTVAVHFQDAVRCEQGTILAILAIVLASVVVLTAISWTLTDAASTFSGPAACGMSSCADEPDDPEAEPHDRQASASRHTPDQVFELVTSTIGVLDPPLAAHSRRVAAAACALAREMEWGEAEIEHLRVGALLHDVGKAPITRTLCPQERDADTQASAQDHPFLGARMLSHLPGCEDIIRTIMYHHECYDGTGFPTGARGDGIPASARIVAIADHYDRLISGHTPVAQAEAIAEIEGHAHTRLDPQLVEHFATLLRNGGIPGLEQASEANCEMRNAEWQSEIPNPPPPIRNPQCYGRLTAGRPNRSR